VGSASVACAKHVILRLREESQLGITVCGSSKRSCHATLRFFAEPQNDISSNEKDALVSKTMTSDEANASEGLFQRTTCVNILTP